MNPKNKSTDTECGTIEIMDSNGFTITVTDLGEAIVQTDRFRQYRHLDKSFEEQDKRLCAYWTDLHTKLLAIQQESKNIQL